jgi:hypothetical protein
MQHNLTVRDVRRDDRPPFPFPGVWTEFKGLGGFGMCNGPCFIYSIPCAGVSTVTWSILTTFNAEKPQSSRPELQAVSAPFYL